MNCRKVQKWLPLYSGGDLPLRMSRKMEIHIRNCGTCRRELLDFQKSLEAARNLMKDASVLGSQAFWERALVRAQAPTSVNRARHSFKPVWTYAALAALAAVLTFLVVKPLPDLETYAGSRIPATSGSQSLQPSSSRQDVISMTLVSKETGLKVQWFLNRNFSLKEDSE